MTAQRTSRVPGTVATKVVAGMRILWKPGDVDDVLAIDVLGGTYLKLTLRDANGRKYARRIAKTGIVEAFWPAATG